MKRHQRYLIHPRNELVEAMERIYLYRMTTTSGGNLSIRDANDDVWITPARIDKGNLKPDDIVCVRQRRSRVKASTNLLPNFHFTTRYTVNARIFALSFMLIRSPWSHSAYAVKCPILPCFPKAYQVCGKVGFAPYELPGSEALGKRIADTFAEGYNSVMLENHGVVIGGATLQEAFERFETLEFTAKIIVKSRMIGQPNFLTENQLKLAETVGIDMEPFNPGDASCEERALRGEIVNFVQRGYRQRLMTSTKGSFSARLSDDSFLITSYNIDRRNLQLEDMSLISNGRYENGKEPSKAVHIHENIYQKYPEIKAIVNATPVNATAFSVSGIKLDSRTIPESYLFLKDIVTIPFEMLYTHGEKIADLLSPAQPVGLIENDGVIVLGQSVLDAFDRLEVLESTAEALINSHFVGTVHSMNDKIIDELIEAFE